MTVSFDPRSLAEIFLVWMRVAPLFVLTPIFGSANVPVRVRVLLGLGIAAMLALASPAQLPTALIGSPWALASAALSEATVGATLAFGLLAAFAAFQFGGRLLDLQVGFGIASLIDPTTRAASPLLGTLLNMCAVAVFLALDGHHSIVRGLAQSLQAFPVGQPFSALNPLAVVAQFGVVFSHGLVLVAPAVFALLLLDVGMAVLARTMPQMNIFIVSMPLKVAVGLLMLALSTRFLLPAMQRVFDTVPLYWLRLLG